jgi:hypothetical protein
MERSVFKAWQRKRNNFQQSSRSPRPLRRRLYQHPHSLADEYEVIGGEWCEEVKRVGLRRAFHVLFAQRPNWTSSVVEMGSLLSNVNRQVGQRLDIVLREQPYEEVCVFYLDGIGAQVKYLRLAC